MPEMPLQAVIVPVTPFAQNCTVLWCTATMKGAFVDPGGDVERLLATAAENNVTIEKILVTHGHIDHAGAVKTLSERLSVPIEGPHQEDTFWIEKLPASGAKYGFDDARVFVPDRWLGDGDTVTVGKLELDVVHCPGHTPGHVIFHHKESKLAMVGDVLFQGSIGRSDFERGDHAALIHSITRKLWPLGNDTTFVPGHGPLSTFAHERATNPFVADRVIARA
jgi:hydroxyacylglutathione hydrolase